MSTLMCKKNIKIISFIIIFIIIILNILSVKSFALVEPTTDFYVADYANLLNSDVKNYIISTNKSLNSQTGAQIVVATVDNLGGEDIEQYSTELFRKFGIGDKTKNNGVLILLALQERKCRIEVGYGLEGALPDAKTGRIQDEYMIPYFKNNNWNDGMKNGYSAILQTVAEEYNVNVGEIKVEKEEETGEYIYIYLIIIIAYIILHKAYTKNKKIKIVEFILNIIGAVLVLIFMKNIVIKSYCIIAQFLIAIGILASFSNKGIRPGGPYWGGGGFFGGGGSFGGGSFGGGGSSGGGGSTRGF